VAGVVRGRWLVCSNPVESTIPAKAEIHGVTKIKGNRRDRGKMTLAAPVVLPSRRTKKCSTLP
jgi:hypothetical protein